MRKWSAKVHIIFLKYTKRGKEIRAQVCKWSKSHKKKRPLPTGGMIKGSLPFCVGKLIGIGIELLDY